jgi:hypothetical protein
MKRKVTNEDVEKFIEKYATQLREELQTLKDEMLTAEKAMLDTFTDEQKFLYCEYLNAKYKYLKFADKTTL